MPNHDHDVVIAGAGPTGLLLAAELALAGVDAVLVEPRADQQLAGSRAKGLHSRSLEILDQRGVVDRFLAAGQIAQVAGFAGVRFDLSGFPTRHGYGLGLGQDRIEHLLADWVVELEVPIRYRTAVTGFVQDGSGVDVTLSEGRTLRTRYLVGCDGGRSLVRKTAGIAFPGWDATISSLIAEVEVTEVPEFGMRRNALGVHSLGRTDYRIVDGEIVWAETGPVGVMVTEASTGAVDEPDLDVLRAAMVAAFGTDYGAHDAIWISRFTDATRQAPAYRDRGVLLAGDSAHVHSPDGGQGLNTGLQDAVNLGWKLAQVVHGTSPDTLLDTYRAERHPVGARVLRTTMAAVALRRDDARTTALRDTVADLLGMAEPRRRLAAQLSQLDVRYDMGHHDLGPGHELLGRRMPDLDLVTAAGVVRVFPLLHGARPVLLNLGAPGALDDVPRPARVQLVDASCNGADNTWELPDLGPVTAPTAVLIRPDGHVAWVGGGTTAGLADALTRWFGSVPTASAPSAA